MFCNILSCALHRGPNRVWLSRRLLLPYSLRPPFGTAIICPLGRLSLQSVLQHLGYLIALDFQLFPIWTDSWWIRSVLKVPFYNRCFRHFLRGFRSGHQIYPIVPTQAVLFFNSNFLRGLRSYHLVFDRLTARIEAKFWGDIACPSVPCEYKGYKIFRETALLLTGEFYPSSHDGEVLAGLIPFSLAEF